MHQKVTFKICRLTSMARYVCIEPGRSSHHGRRFSWDVITFPFAL